MINLYKNWETKKHLTYFLGVLNEWCQYGLRRESKESGDELKKEYKFEIQEIMHSQYKYKGDNRYLSFHECLCRFSQNKINRIIESAFWQGH